MNAAHKIKICHLSSVHHTRDIRIFYKECRSLARIYDVTLIAQGSEKQIIDGVKIIPVAVPPNRLYRFLITDFVVLFRALSVNARVYHFYDPELILAGLILRLAGKKVVYDVLEDVRSDIKEKEWLPLKFIFIGLYSLFESLAVRFFYLVLAEASYAEIYERQKGDYIVVQNFVPLDALTTNIDKYDKESSTLGLIGYLSARRALPYILDALWILQKKGLIIRLKCIGTRDHAVDDILEKSKAWPHIKSQVEFPGYLPFPEGVYALSGCFAGLALPETLPNHIRSYPTKMFEYMAMGLPIIASDFPLYTELVQKYDIGLNVCPEDSRAIAAAIEKLYTNRELAGKMGENGRKAVVHFNWQTEAEKLEQLYQKILR